MSRNTYCKPKLLIEGREVQSLETASFNDSGNNKLSALKARFTEPDLVNISLFNKKVEFYLNYGSEDSYPMFRGYIKHYTSTDTSFSITALDVRTLITGNESFPVVVDEANNYDGQTIIQFLIDVIDNQLNLDEGLSTNATNDIDKPIYMTGDRGKDSIYSILTRALKDQLDDDDLLQPLYYYLDVVHEETNSSIVIKKAVDTDSRIDCNFSYFDGIVSLVHTERPPPSFGIAESSDGSQVRFDYGNSPAGKYGVVLDNVFQSRGEGKEALIPFVLSKQDSELHIEMRVSKGHYLSLGNIVKLDVPDMKLSGSYRVTSKNVKFAKGTVSCTLKLNKKELNLSDFI